MRAALSRVWFVVTACAVIATTLRVVLPLALESLLAAPGKFWNTDTEVERRGEVLTLVRRALPRASTVGYLFDAVAMQEAGTAVDFQKHVVQYWLAPHAVTIYFENVPFALVDLRFGADPARLLAHLPTLENWEVVAVIDKELMLLKWKQAEPK